jgi:hypothetical protein
MQYSARRPARENCGAGRTRSPRGGAPGAGGSGESARMAVRSTCTSGCVPASDVAGRARARRGACHVIRRERALTCSAPARVRQPRHLLESESSRQRRYFRTFARVPSVTLRGSAGDATEPSADYVSDCGSTAANSQGAESRMPPRSDRPLSPESADQDERHAGHRRSHPESVLNTC